MEKSKLSLTFLSISEFKNLNLVGKREVKAYFTEDGERVPAENAYVHVPEHEYNGVKVPAAYVPQFKYTKLIIEDVDLSALLQAEVDAIFGDGINEWMSRYIMIAIHNEPKDYTGNNAMDVERYYDGYYCDKYLTQGARVSFILACGVAKLYSTRDYFESHEDYLKIKKKETKAIYMVRVSN